MSRTIGPPMSGCASQNFSFGTPVKPRAWVGASMLSPMSRFGSYDRTTRLRYALPPLLIVEMTAAPGVFIVTS